MDNTIATASDLQLQFNAAGADFDFKTLAQTGISVLFARENELGTAETDAATMTDKIAAMISQANADGKTISDLNDQLTKAQTDFAGCYKAYNELKANPDAEELQEQLDGALATIRDLGAKLNFQEQTKSQPGIAVQLADGSNKLLIGGKFTIPKQGTFTAAQVAASPELIAYLVSINSGSLIDPTANGSTSANTAS